MKSSDRLPPLPDDADGVARASRRHYSQQSRPAVERFLEAFRRTVIPLGRRLGLAIVAVHCEEVVPKVRRMVLRLYQVGVQPSYSATGRRPAVDMIRTGTTAGKAASATVSRKLILMLAAVLTGVRGGRAAVRLAIESVRIKVSDDPRLLLKVLIVVAGLAVSVVCGLALPGVFGVVPPTK